MTSNQFITSRANLSQMKRKFRYWTNTTIRCMSSVQTHIEGKLHHDDEAIYITLNTE